MKAAGHAFCAIASLAAVAVVMVHPLPSVEEESSSFTCLSALVEPLRIWKSFVDDGFVDCCDGSDENFEGIEACAAQANARLEELKEIDLRNGVLVPEAMDELVREAVLVSEDAAEAVREAKPSIKAAVANPPKDPWSRRRVEEAVSRLRYTEAIAERDPRLYGERGAWLGLMDKCFDSAPMSEKRTLGGTSQVEPTEYIFRICPMSNVTQRVASKSRGEGSAHRQRSSETLLGQWRAWAEIENHRGKTRRELLYMPNHNISMSYGDARRSSSLQFYDGGQSCVGDRTRSVLVRLVCADDGKTHEIVSVDEDGMCRYYVDFATPLGCGLLDENDDEIVTGNYSTAAHDRRNEALRLTLQLKWHSYIVFYRRVRRYFKPAERRLVALALAVSRRILEPSNS